MNSTFKSNYLHLPIILLLLLTIFSCEKENLEDLKGQNQNTQSINFTVHSTEHLVQNDNNLKQALQLLNTKRQKATASSVYNFGIYESSVQVLEATNYTQYTFEVYRNTPLSNQLENYVLLVYPDGSIKQYLVKYNIYSGGTHSLEGIQSIDDSDLNMTKSTCNPELIEQQDFTTCTSYPCGGDGHYVGQECSCGEENATCTDKAYIECVDGTVYVFQDNNCGSVSDDGNPTPPNTSSPEEPTSANGPGSTTPNDPNDSNEPEEETITINAYTKVSQCTKDAINNLPQDMADWINSLENCVFGGTTCNQQLYDDITGFVNANKEDCVLSDEAENRISNIYSSFTNNTLVSASPLFKFPLNSNYELVYPKLTEYLKNKLPDVADINLIVNTINEITGVSTSIIKNDLQWGHGPTISIVQLDNYSVNTNANTVGAFDKSLPNNILLDVDYVNGLENGTSNQLQEDGLLFYLGVVILHEYVHLTDQADGSDYPGEEGEIFELKVYGQSIDPTIAETLIFQKYY